MRLQKYSWWLSTCLLATLANPLAAQEDSGKSNKAQQAINNLRQPGDDEVSPLEPVTSASEADKKKSGALTWFMTGRLRQRAAESRELTPAEIRKLRIEAFEAYKSAIDLDPKALEVYRAIIPLAFQLNRTKEAAEFAQKAVKADPTDYRLLRLLGDISFRAQQLGATLGYYEKAAQSDKLVRESADHVLLRRDLAVLYGLANDLEKSAESYDVVFDARRNPSRYKLEPRLTRALEQDPQTSFLRMGQVFLATKRADKAVIAFELVAQKTPKVGPHTFLLSKAYLEVKKFDKAEETLEKFFAAKLPANNSAGYELLAEILKGSQREDELIPRLEALAAAEPQNAELSFFLASSYAQNDELDKAETLYLKTLAGSGARKPAGYLGLAVVHRRKKQALKLLEAFINGVQAGAPLDSLTPALDEVREDNDFFKSVVETGKTLMATEKLEPAGGYMLGRMSADAKQNEDAKAFFKFSIDQKPKGNIALSLFNEYGALLLDIDDFEEAARVYDLAASHPDLRQSRPIMLYRLSFAHELNGATDEALEAIVDARRNVRSPLLYYQEGWIYQHSKQYDEAIKIFEKVMVDFAADIETVRKCQLSLSNIFVAKGEMRKGEEILEKVLEEDPDNTTVNNDLGYLYADQGKNLERAEKMIRKAIKAEPDNAAYQDSMGWVLYRLGRHAEAATFLEKAISLPGGPDATILEHLGDVYDKLNKKDKSLDAWKKALLEAEKERNPDPELLKRLKEKTAAN